MMLCIFIATGASAESFGSGDATPPEVWGSGSSSDSSWGNNSSGGSSSENDFFGGSSSGNSSGSSSSKGSSPAVEPEMIVNIPADVVNKDIIIETPRYEITATYTLPEGEGPFPLVIMSHGFLGGRNQRGGFAAIAVELAHQGIASIRMDFAGCGDSTADFQLNNLTGMASDVIACREWAINNLPVDKDAICLLGYSLGSLVSLCATLHMPDICNAMVLLAPAGMVDIRSLYYSQYQEALKDGYYTTVSYGKSYNVSTSWYEDLFSLEILLKTYNARANVFMVYGTRDTLLSVETALQCAEKLQAKKLEIDGAYHSLGLSGTMPAIFEQVKSGVVEYITGIFAPEISDFGAFGEETAEEETKAQTVQGSGTIHFGN